MTSKSRAAFRQIELWARLGVGLVWLWHGLVPKLIVNHAVESAPLVNAGIDHATAGTIVAVSGVLEIVFGLVVVVAKKFDWPLWLSIVAMLGLLLGVIITDPAAVTRPFNPVTTNILVVLLAGICLVSRVALRESDSSNGEDD